MSHLASSNFERWRRAQGLSYRELGERYGVGLQQAYVHCRPPGSARHKIPRPGLMRRIFEITAGAITPNDFYDLPALATPGSTITESPHEGEAAE